MQHIWEIQISLQEVKTNLVSMCRMLTEPMIVVLMIETMLWEQTSHMVDKLSMIAFSRATIKTKGTVEIGNSNKMMIIEIMNSKITQDSDSSIVEKKL